MQSSAARNVSGTKKAVGVLGVMVLSAAVALFALGGATRKSAVAACNTNAKAVEAAASMFQIQHSGVTPTAAQLTDHADGDQMLKSWPNGGSTYAITLNGAGAVMISVPAKAPAVSYDTANPCATAA
jgi:hypothetical protein